MKRKLKIILCIVVLAPFALALGFTLYARGVYNVSAMAKLTELYLRITNWSEVFETAENMQRHLEKRAVANEQPVKAPRVRSNLEQYEMQGFQVFQFGKSEGSAAVVYLHGGAYVNQPDYFHWKFVDKIARQTDLPLFMPIYPKAPNYTYITGYNFLLDFYLDLLAKGFQNIIIAGDSAGGGFALGFAQYLIANEELPLPKKLILISPWLDISMENPEIADFTALDVMLAVPGGIVAGKAWASETPAVHYLLSPINGSFEGLPPIVMLSGTHDILVPDIRKLYQMYSDNGVDITYHEVYGMGHVYPLYPIPEARHAIRIIVEGILAVDTVTKTEEL